MAKALGIGGVFFKSKDHAALVAWYAKHLQLKPEGDGYVAFKPESLPPGSCSVFSPFAASTDYFKPSKSEFMVNLIVDDLEGALAQVREGGGEVVGGIDDHDYGRFGWVLDPDGNKVELWEPKEAT